MTQGWPIVLSVVNATRFPEYENLQVLTADLVSICSSILPLDTSQRRIVLSAAPDKKYLVCQSTSRHQTAPAEMWIKKFREIEIDEYNNIQCVPYGSGWLCLLITERLITFPHFWRRRSAWYFHTFCFLRKIFDSATGDFSPQNRRGDPYEVKIWLSFFSKFPLKS